MCMPQNILREAQQEQKEDARTEMEKREFGLMLSNCNLLYVGLRVLILSDMQYSGRFWTSYESYLSMQFPTPEGLVPAKHSGEVFDDRWAVIAVEAGEAGEGHGLSKAAKVGLEALWLDEYTDMKKVTVFLKNQDVKVTHPGDKTTLIPRLAEFEQLVREKAKALGLRKMAEANLLDLAPMNKEVAAKLDKKKADGEKQFKQAQKQGAFVKQQLASTEARNAHREKAKQQAAQEARARAKLQAVLRPVEKELKEVKQREKAAISREKLLQGEVERLKREIESLGGGAKQVPARVNANGAGMSNRPQRQGQASLGARPGSRSGRPATSSNRRPGLVKRLSSKFFGTATPSNASPGGSRRRIQPDGVA